MRKVKRLVPSVASINGDLKGPEKKVLRALGELLSIGKHNPPKNMVGGWSAYSPTSGGFANILSGLKTKGLIEYPALGTIALTSEGSVLIGHCTTPSRQELFRRFESLCSGPERKVLEILLANEEGLSKEELGTAAGYSPTSGGFANLLSALRTKGLAEYPSPGKVKAPSWIFEL